MSTRLFFYMGVPVIDLTIRLKGGLSVTCKTASDAKRLIKEAKAEGKL